jgi:hypothetical protein
MIGQAYSPLFGFYLARNVTEKAKKQIEAQFENAAVSAWD